MTREEKSRKLNTLPWQALYNTALEMKMEEEEINSLTDKETIIEKLLLNDIENDVVEKLFNDYIYGNRVTFSLWSFDHTLTDEESVKIQELEGEEEHSLDINGFRKLKVLSVGKLTDRFQILYTYSKEHTFIDEGGHDSCVWELHRGCLWIGLNETYLACISKHDKMTKAVVNFIANYTDNHIEQMRFPKKAIDRCVDPEAITRVVLQGMNGEKTAISKAGGITDGQKQEIENIQSERIDTSGSYIAHVSEDTLATIKYNTSRGNIGIYKHLSSEELFQWTGNAIQIVMEEIQNLKGKPAEDIFREVGQELKWRATDSIFYPGLNWLLTQVISATNDEDKLSLQIDECVRNVLECDKYFLKIPRVFCPQCDAYEVPVCAECGEILKSDVKGNLFCKCGAPLQIICPEHHSNSTEIRYWYVAKSKLLTDLNKQLLKIFKDVDFDYNICIMDDLFNIMFVKQCERIQVEIPFTDVKEFQNIPDNYSSELCEYVLSMKEKCTGTCSYAAIEKCIEGTDKNCLPKAFYRILPGFRPQPHGVKEYGDFSSQITVYGKHYEMKGIIKSNTKNRGKEVNLEEMAHAPLLPTSKEGMEIIRQFVEQGMNDKRCEVVAVVAPQHIDNGLKGTLKYLARLSNIKVIFIELEQMCKIVGSQFYKTKAS